MSLIIEVSHLPSGQVYESGPIPDEQYEPLLTMIEASNTLTFTNPAHGTYFFPCGVLEESVILIRHEELT